MRRQDRSQKRVARAGRLASVEPRIEVLEPRLPLASDVALALSPRTWTITGDTTSGSTADTIVIDRDPSRPGMLRATVNDVVVARRPESRVATIRVFGGQGNDVITVAVPGNAKLRTQLFGNAGDDTITAGDQSDEIRGGSGDDTILGGRGDDRIYGEEGDDTINGGDGNDFLRGGTGDDVIAGAAGNDTLQGNPGDDTLRGGNGRNTLDGGLGNDAYYGFRDRDRVRRFDDGEAMIGDESTNPLRLATDVDQFKSWYIDTAIARWGSLLGRNAWSWYGIDGPRIMNDDGLSVAASPATTGDFSGTNNQVNGVEEGDRVKTDGQHLFVLAGDGVDIVNAWPAESLAVVGHVTTDGDERALFLHGTRLTVISQESWWGEPSAGVSPALVGCFIGGGRSRVHVTVIDVSDAAQPTVLEKTSLDGWFIDARAIDNRVVVVVQNTLDIPAPAIIAVPPPGETPSGDSGAPPVSMGPAPIAVRPLWVGDVPLDGTGSSFVYEDLPAYRARLEAAWNEKSLPRYTVTVAAESRDAELIMEGHAYMPVAAADDRLLAVASFTIDDDTPGIDSATTVAGISGNIYASPSRLYVYASHVGAWWDVTDDSTTTNVYQFDLDDADVPLAAMGAFPGLPLNQFSFDEYDGRLRVATTVGFGDHASNGVFVLAASGGNLQTVGSIVGLAPGERIYSVRFAGAIGYVSTFRQVDPLFVLDFAEPDRPRVVGELKIPGFSTLLHPLDETHLLGIGRDVDPDTGRVLGLQLSIFDVGDPAAPRRTATYTFPGDESWSAALWDHHALSWFPQQGILALPVQQGSWWNADSGLVIFRVDPNGDIGFTKLGEISHESGVDRSIRIGECIYSVSAGEIKVHRLVDPGEQLAATRLSTISPSWTAT